VVAVLLAAATRGCSMVGQPPLSLNKSVEAPPEQPAQVVRLHYESVGAPLLGGEQLSEPAVAPDSLLGRRIWFSCLRRTDGSESVLIFASGRVADEILGPSPHFCTDRQFSPIRHARLIAVRAGSPM